MNIATKLDSEWFIEDVLGVLGKFKNEKQTRRKRLYKWTLTIMLTMQVLQHFDHVGDLN
jgi:hypothetical protein